VILGVIVRDPDEDAHAGRDLTDTLGRHVGDHIDVG
jgi:hypothetical protein